MTALSFSRHHDESFFCQGAPQSVGDLRSAAELLFEEDAHVLREVAPLLHDIPIRLELLCLDQPVRGDPYERVPPEERLEELHDEPFGRMAVADVAPFVGDDGGLLGVGKPLGEVYRAAEGEGGHRTAGPHEPDAAAEFDRGTPFEPPDRAVLPEQRPQDQRHACAVDQQDELVRRVKRLADRSGDRLGRDVAQDDGGPGDRRGAPYGNAQQRNPRRQQGHGDQVAAAQGEGGAPFEQQRVGGQQNPARRQHLQQIDDRLLHGCSCFFARSMISSISSISSIGSSSCCEKKETIRASDPPK